MTTVTPYNKHFLRGPKPGETGAFQQRYIAMLDDDVFKGSFFFNCTFMEPKYSTGIHSPHTHPYPEILFFHGLDPDNPYDLGWEIDLYMGPEFERYTIDKTSLVYIPARFIHCPIISRMRKPAFHVYCMAGPLLVRDDYNGLIKQEGTFEKHYDKYFISGVRPDVADKGYQNYTTYIDNNIIEGSFHFASTFVDTEYIRGEQSPHTHPRDLVLGFFGNDPENRFDLGAEIEFCLGEELHKYSFNQSTLVYIPSGLTHCITKCAVKRPFIFVECARGPLD